jgi:hypothetical protein
MQSFVITLCWVEIVALLVGGVMILASQGGSDAAGRALGIGYTVIGMTVLLIVFVLPALWLARSGHVVWLAATLAGVAAIPAFVLAVGGLVGVVEFVAKKLRRR